MKKLKIILLLLSLTFICKAQTFVVSDRLWNVEASLNDYSGIYESHYISDINLESYTISTNELTLDTLLNTLTIVRKSNQTTDSIYWDLNITTTNTVDGHGTTYNFEDYINGVSGLLFVETDGTILFLVEKSLYPDEYFGFLGSIEYPLLENCFTY